MWVDVQAMLGDDGFVDLLLDEVERGKADGEREVAKRRAAFKDSVARVNRKNPNMETVLVDLARAMGWYEGVNGLPAGISITSVLRTLLMILHSNAAGFLAGPAMKLLAGVAGQQDDAIENSLRRMEHGHRTKKDDGEER